MESTVRLIIASALSAAVLAFSPPAFADACTVALAACQSGNGILQGKINQLGNEIGQKNNQISQLTGQIAQKNGQIGQLNAQIAQKTNTVVVPANVSDVAGMIAVAMKVFDTPRRP